MDYKNTDDKTGGTIRIHKKKSTTNTTNDNDSVIPQEDSKFIFFIKIYS